MMTAPAGSNLLTVAPTGHHFAQFHRDTEGQDRRRDTLTESALLFVEAGLRRGDSVVVIAGADQRDRLFERLPQVGFAHNPCPTPGHWSALVPGPSRANSLP